MTSSQTPHAALRGFAEAESDGIVQISPGRAEFLGGQYSKDKVTGTVALIEEINEALENAVVKMNIDTDTRYAFTRAVAGHMFRNYDGVLKVDGEVGEVGDKKTYDPRTWGKAAEAGMAARVGVACENLHSAGKKMK